MTRSTTLVITAVILLGAAQVAQAQVEWTVHHLAVPHGDPGTWNVGGPGEMPIPNPWAVGHWYTTDVTDVTDPWREDPANPARAPWEP